MGLCSAKALKTKNNANKDGVPNNTFSKGDNSLELSKANKSERSIQTNQINNQTPKRQGQLIVPQNESKKPVKRTAWADQLIKNNQYRTTLKTCISIRKVPFSKHYTIVGKSKAYPRVKLQKQMTLVQHNLSGNIKIAELINRSTEGGNLVEGIVERQLLHPNLLRIFEIFQNENHYQIIHDFCSGGQLLQYIEQKPYTQQEAAIILKQIIDVVLYIHQHELHHDFLTLQSFQKCNQSNSNYIKLTEFKSIFIKSIPNDNEYIYYLSPEAIKIQDLYSQERDAWSIGIILYKMLTGQYPFKGGNLDEIYQSISKYSQNDNIDFRQIPSECVHLIKSFLKINPKKRIRLSEALDNQWLQNNILKSEKELNVLVQQLENNHTLSFLQCCFLEYMISQIQQEQEQHLYQYFCQFDTNHDGKVNRKDLTQAYLKFNSNIQEVKEQVDAIFQGLDFNSKGEIDFQEFKIGVVDKSQLLTEENLKFIFQILTDVEGFITLQKMISLYPNKKEQLKTHFTIYDQNQINLKQFEELMYDAL